MKIVLRPLLATLLLNSIGVTSAGADTYVGMADRFSSSKLTWGWSTKKLSKSYSGHFGVVRRLSDSQYKLIGFDSLGNADAAALTTFCAHTSCVWTRIYDQIGASDVVMSNVVAAVAADGGVEVCPGPGGVGFVPYSADYSSPHQELFAVAKLGYMDNRYSQRDLPGVTLTGEVTAGSATLSQMSSQAGISTANNQYKQPGLTGVADSAHLLPPATALSALQFGTSAIMAFNPGNLLPKGTDKTDELTVTNAVLGGPWIQQAPANSSMSSAYWGFGLSVNSIDAAPGDFTIVRNGSASTKAGVAGQAMRAAWGVWDVDSATGAIYYDGALISTWRTASNVSYPTQVGLTLFNDANGGNQLQTGCFRQMVLASAIASPRTTIDAWLATQFDAVLPTSGATYNTPDGFEMRPELLTAYGDVSSAYGQVSFADANGITWYPQSGGYPWPSLAHATNINNGGTMQRFIVWPGDSDSVITQAERSEAASNARIQPGQSASFFDQFMFERYAAQTGDWCARGQIHFDNSNGNSAPDIVAVFCKGSKLQIVRQNGALTSTCGAAITLTQGVTYAVQGEITWSASHLADTLDVYIGVNGTSLAHQCSASGVLFPIDTGAYMKAGIYRGYPNSNAGGVVLREMNMQWSNTANAFAAFRTKQPALPTHN